MEGTANMKVEIIIRENLVKAYCFIVRHVITVIRYKVNKLIAGFWWSCFEDSAAQS